MSNSLSNYLDMSQEGRINKFYNQGSIHVPNKFVVGLWGEYITSALQYMSDYTVHDPLLGVNKLVKNTRLYSGVLTRWLQIHSPDTQLAPSNVFANGNVRDIIKTVKAVELLWACQSIQFPSTVKPKVDNIKIDTYKNISYPVITGHNGPGDVKLTIVEDRTLMFYQFFNAIMNQFFDPLILKARSSFHKMGMYIVSMDGFSMPYIQNDGSENFDERNKARWAVEDVPLQVFEFNSVILTDIGDVSYSNDSIKPATYTITIRCPNLFQDAFKTTSNFRGLANNTSDKRLLNGVDASGLIKDDNKNNMYNVGTFEDKTNYTDANKSLVSKKGRYTDFKI